MRTDWMKSGADHNGTPKQKARLRAAIDHMPWEPMERGKQWPMMPALGISKVIEECNVPRVSHVGHSHEWAPYGLYAIRGWYKVPGSDPVRRHAVDVFVVDEGSTLAPVCCDVYEEAEKADPWKKA